MVFRTTDSKHFLSCLVLPLWVHGKKENCPREKVGAGLLPCKMEGLALFYDLTHVDSIGHHYIDQIP